MNSFSPKNNGSGIQLLLVGLLSMFYAEVFAGASLLWFANLWSLLVTFPLYLSHTLFFLNIAIRLKRTTIHHLYLFGVLFGLYESWVTKVTWAGYTGMPPEMGTFLGFAVAETAVIVFFWHPFLSFIMPILTIEVLAMNDNQNTLSSTFMFPSHLSILRKSKRNMAFFVFVFVLGSAGLTLNSTYNLSVALTTLLGTLVILYAFYRLAKSKSPLSIHNLKLGRKGFTITGVYILLLYVFMFLNLRPENIPNLGTIILTLFLYLVVIAAILVSKPIEESNIDAQIDEIFFSKKRLVKLVALMILLVILFCILPPLGFLTFLALYHVALVLGPAFFVYTLVRALINN